MKMIFVESNSWAKASLSDYDTLMGIPCYLHGADCGRENGLASELAWLSISESKELSEGMQPVIYPP